jgi:hypothetical protein
VSETTCTTGKYYNIDKGTLYRPEFSETHVVRRTCSTSTTQGRARGCFPRTSSCASSHHQYIVSAN